MGKIKVLHNFPVPPLNKGALNSLKITEPSLECSEEKGTFGGSLYKCNKRKIKVGSNHVFMWFNYAWGKYL